MLVLPLQKKNIASRRPKKTNIKAKTDFLKNKPMSLLLVIMLATYLIYFYITQTNDHSLKGTDYLGMALELRVQYCKIKYHEYCTLISTTIPG